MLTETELKADQNAREGRNAILRVRLGRHASRRVLRAIQGLGLYPKA